MAASYVKQQCERRSSPQTPWSLAHFPHPAHVDATPVATMPEWA